MGWLARQSAHEQGCPPPPAGPTGLEEVATQYDAGDDGDPEESEA